MKSEDKIFSEKIKSSLQEILSHIDDIYIITFYSAYKSIFKEEYDLVQKVYDKVTEDYKGDIDLAAASIDWGHYLSGHCPLDRVNVDNNGWKWLSEQLKSGKIKEAFSFIDQDKRKSDFDAWGYRSSVSVYLTVKEVEPYLENKKVLISMYALDIDKSVYRFEVNKEKIYEAIF